LGDPLRNGKREIRIFQLPGNHERKDHRVQYPFQRMRFLFIRGTIDRRIIFGSEHEKTSCENLQVFAD